MGNCKSNEAVRNDRDAYSLTGINNVRHAWGSGGEERAAAAAAEKERERERHTHT